MVINIMHAKLNTIAMLGRCMVAVKLTCAKWSLSHCPRRQQILFTMGRDQIGKLNLFIIQRRRVQYYRPLGFVWLHVQRAKEEEQ